MAGHGETLRLLGESIKSISAQSEAGPRETAEAEAAYYGLKSLLAVHPYDKEENRIDVLQIMDLGDPDGQKTYFIQRILTPQGSVVRVFIRPGIENIWPENLAILPFTKNTDSLLIIFDENSQPAQLARLLKEKSESTGLYFYDEASEINVQDMNTIPQKADLFRTYHRLFENLIPAHRDYEMGELGDYTELSNGIILAPPVYIAM